MAGPPEPTGSAGRSLSERGPGDGQEDLPTDGSGLEVGSRFAPEEWRPVQFHGRRTFELGAGAFFLFYTVLAAIDGIGPGFTRWLLPAVLGINTIHFLRRALDPRPRLALERDGIRDRTSIGSVGLFIPWEEVEGVQIAPGRRTVELRVRDPVRLRQTTGWVRRFWMVVGGLAGKKTISINPGFLSLKKHELTDIIEEGLFAFERSQLGFGSEEGQALLDGHIPDPGATLPTEDSA